MSSALKSLASALDFGSDQLQVLSKTGQYVFDLMGESPSSSDETFAEVMTVSSAEPAVHPSQPDADSPESEGCPKSEDPPCHVWIQEDIGADKILIRVEGPKWDRIRRRIVRDANSRRVIASHEPLHLE